MQSYKGPSVRMTVNMYSVLCHKKTLYEKFFFIQLCFIDPFSVGRDINNVRCCAFITLISS